VLAAHPPWPVPGAVGRTRPASPGPRQRGSLRIILICNQGYQSSLAAATLQQLGLTHATDLDGGFTAWAAAGLPVIPSGAGHHPPGDRHPDSQL
jgi:3-mercaptopyruvate sulfurtransferase SseA